MQGKIIIDGKKMTVLELFELYAETKNDLSVANQLIEAKQREIEKLESEVKFHKNISNNIKENYKYLSTRCMSGADLAFSEHRFGCLTICLNSEYEKLRNTIDDLERELRVKEDLFKIQSGLKNGEFSETVEIDGEYRRLIHTESGTVKISNLPYKEESRPSIEWYEQRYQSDCITINQLHTTIDVLTDELTNLRKQMGVMLENCNLTTCRYNKDGKCTNDEKRKECVDVSRKVLCKE